MMHPAVEITFNLLVGLLLVAYLRHSLRSRAAVGLWWDFQREDEPVRYWLQLAIVGVAIGECLWRMTKLFGWN